jgi:aromatic ring-opening dioxygenase catalytic subunit (LigB family)
MKCISTTPRTPTSSTSECVCGRIKQCPRPSNTADLPSFYGFPPEYYKATFPSKGSPELASRILSLLSGAGIKAKGLKRGLDHGVFSGFNVAFSPEENPLQCPLVQVSLFNSEDPDAHYRLGQAVAALRDENIVIICTGMSVVSTCLCRLSPIHGCLGNSLHVPETATLLSALLN